MGSLLEDILFVETRNTKFLFKVLVSLIDDC